MKVPEEDILFLEEKINELFTEEFLNKTNNDATRHDMGNAVTALLQAHCPEENLSKLKVTFDENDPTTIRLIGLPWEEPDYDL